ncbi:hypothetical protein [Marinovum sp.]|uniref:hypothetical protein n=1 Tax=Marinovum sp. TaxID=2024839 RepID=UPI002B27A3DE|nr:hypothetical protein [Marinovum sp.]
MFLITAAILFAVFVANVLVGATGGAQFLGDVGEALLLFAASVAFVLAILRREAAEKNRNT